MMWSNAGKYIRCRKRSASEISASKSTSGTCSSASKSSDTDTDTTAATAPYSQDDDSNDGDDDSHDSDVSNEKYAIPENITPLDISRRFSTHGHLLEKRKVPQKLPGKPHRQREPKDMLAVSSCMATLTVLRTALHGVCNIARHICTAYSHVNVSIQMHIFMAYV